MELRAVGLAVRKPDQRHSLEFSPTASALLCLELLSLADGKVNGYWLDVLDIAEELEIYLDNSSTATACSRLTVGKSSKK
jgi:hypothetical protein